MSSQLNVSSITHILQAYFDKTKNHIKDFTVVFNATLKKIYFSYIA